MSKYKVKGKKRRRPTAREFFAAGGRPSDKKQRRTALLLVLWCVLFAGAYFTALRLQHTAFYVASEVIVGSMYVLLPLLIIVFIIVGGGISRDIPTPEQLAPSYTHEEKNEIIDKIKKRRRAARPIAYPILPLCLIVGFDIISVMVSK